MIEDVNNIRDIEGVSSTVKSFLFALASRANKTGTAFPSFSRLMKDSEIGNRGTLGKVSKEAENLGLIFVERRIGRVNQYHLKLSTSANSATGSKTATSANSATATSANIGPTTSTNTATLIDKTNIQVKKPYKKNVEKSAIIPDCLKQRSDFETAWSAFLENRKALKKPATVRAQELLLQKLSQHPHRVIEALNTAIERGWTGFEWDWLDNNNNKRTTAQSQFDLSKHHSLPENERNYNCVENMGPRPGDEI